MLYDSIQINAQPKDVKDVVTLGYVGNVNDIEMEGTTDLVTAINLLNSQLKTLNEKVKSSEFIQVNDYIVYSGPVINLTHQNIVESEDFELTVNGIEYLMGRDFDVDFTLGEVTWKDDSFELDDSMRILAQYKIRKRDE